MDKEQVIKPRRVTKLIHAKKLLSDIITRLQTKAIEDKDAKTLIYALSVFVGFCKDVELEQRITEIEALIKSKDEYEQ